jgi:hypothetical protein
MEFTPEVIQFWIAAFFFILATLYLRRRIRTEKLQSLNPIAVYLGSISVFFVIMGLMQFVDVAIFSLIGAFAVMYGASYIARFPLRMIIPNRNNERFVFGTLVFVSVILTLFNFIFRDTAMMFKVAHTFAFFIAGIFTIGYILYMGFTAEQKTVKTKSISSGISLGLCCIAAHGLVGFQLLPLIAVPLFGLANIPLPLFFAILSPISFLLVILASHRFQKENAKENFKNKITEPTKSKKVKIIVKNDTEVLNAKTKK